MMARIENEYPQYQSTALLDELRATEYSYLDLQDHVYLDYTGSGLAATAQVRHHQERLAKTVYGNPHSINPTSAITTEAIEQTRARVLSFLKASPAEYAVVFTANASGAAKLVGEAYPFRRGSRLVLLAENHNSVNGLREYAHAAKAPVTYVPLQQPDLRATDEDVVSALSPGQRHRRFFDKLTPLRCRAMLRSNDKSSGPDRPVSKGLFAYPAQSNFTGVRHPLAWVSQAQQRGYHVLLDAAAYLPTATLDLSSQVKPDFLLVSWYKLFGYPTGVGCLVARHDALALLRPRRPWFAGGTVTAATVAAPWHAMAPGPEAFEDGTPNFLAVPDARFGLDWLAGIGMAVVETRVRCLTGWFLQRLRQLKHSDGRAMVCLYGPVDMEMRGGTVAFNFVDAAGRVVDDRIVAMESAAARISLRTGCFCNPGAGEAAFGLDANAVKRLNQARGSRRGFDHVVVALGAPPLGAVRVSFGLASNAADVDKFIGFAEKTYKDRVIVPAGLGPRDQC